jgi:hypothetical protein
MAYGQNLVSNPGFDTDVAGWSALSGATLAWDFLDAAGDPFSGSALVTNLSTNPLDGGGAAQCIDGLAGAQHYRLSAEINIPSGQLETGSGYLLVQWYGAAGCSSFVGLSESPSVYSTTTDVWATSSIMVQSPLGTQSGRLRLSVLKNEAGGSLAAHFDNAWLEPAIFFDGFESGDVSAWSLTAP